MGFVPEVYKQDVLAYYFNKAAAEDKEVVVTYKGQNLRYTAQDIRFTAKDNILYATVLGWPGEKVLIKSLAGGPDPNRNFWNGLYPSAIVSIHMLGDGKELKWEMTTEGLTVETTKTKPCEHAFVFKVVRKKPF